MGCNCGGSEASRERVAKIRERQRARARGKVQGTDPRTFWNGPPKKPTK